MKCQKLKPTCFIIVLVLIFLSGCAPQQFKTDLFSSFEHESQLGPTGLAWDGKNLIMGTENQILFARDIVTEQFFSFSKKDTTLNGGSYTSGRFPGPQRIEMDITGMTWEGECCGEGYLWVADAKNDMIIKLKPDLQFVSQFPSPIPNPNGLAFDGKSFWIVSKNSFKIVQFNPDTQSIENIYYSPIHRPTGLAWDCKGYIWVIGINDCRTNATVCNTSRLVRIDINTGKVTHELKLPDVITRPTSIAISDKYFWIGDYNLNRVFKLPFDERKFEKIDMRPHDITKAAEEGKVDKMPMPADNNGR